MIIHEELCVGCGQCQPYCPAEAIEYGGLKSVVDQDKCLECGCCRRVAICPVDALGENPLAYEYPRALRKNFSDPAAPHIATGIEGRGTEECKTNDITNRVGSDTVGIAIEVGRPTIGMGLRDVQKISRALAKAGVTEIESENPIHQMYENPATGDLKESLLNERVLSAIIEMQAEKGRLGHILRTIKQVAGELDSSVFTLDVFMTVEPDLKLPQEVFDTFEAEGFPWKPNAKINMGLGRASDLEGGAS